MGTPNKLSQQVDETGPQVQAVVQVDPTNPQYQVSVNSDGSLNIRVVNGNANGQATMVNSAPVVVASDQTPIPVSGNVQLTGSSSVFAGVTPSLAYYNGTQDFDLISAATNNATNIRGQQASVYGWTISNTTASWRYVKLYNKATAPAPATDSALLIRTIGIAPGATVNYFNIAGSLSYTNGIGLAAVTGAAVADNTSVGADDLIIHIDWK